jgi:hypothetical protein
LLFDADPDPSEKSSPCYKKKDKILHNSSKQKSHTKITKQRYRVSGFEGPTYEKINKKYFFGAPAKKDKKF